MYPCVDVSTQLVDALVHGGSASESGALAYSIFFTPRRLKAGKYVLRNFSWVRLTNAILITTTLLYAAACAPVIGGPDATPTQVRQLPLIYGVNLSLYDTNDQIVNNLATQQLLKQKRVPIIRMPFRFELSDTYELQALRTIKELGAIPLIIIHGATDQQALADDRHLISLTQTVFGSDMVYVEFGNEPDLAGVDVRRYTDAWNATIPQLKAMAPSYKFIGPVNFEHNPTYVATFDRYASPQPDLNSWHEYACHPGDTDADCISHLDDWTAHIQQTNKAVQAAIGRTVPIMLTEWNLDAEPDARYTNASFIQRWTTLALRTLDENRSRGLTAAMYYCITNHPSFSLIDGANSLTPEGQSFFQSLGNAGNHG